MFDKQFLGSISVALTLLGYAPYFRSILKRKTKPHMFSWIVWGIVNAIACAGQFSRGAGAGSWVAGLTAFLCILIAGLSTTYGEKNITKSDWVAFIVALTAIPLWRFTNDPLGAVILATLIDVVGCYPTIRKSYTKPHEENAFIWSIAALRSFISFFAIEHYSLVTTFFPITMIFTNGGLAALVLWRRQVIKKGSN